MKITRKVSSSRIMVALIIAGLIFCLGITLGFVLDGQRLQWIQYQSQQQKSDYESLQWQYLFLTSVTDKEQTCAVLKVTLEKSITDLSRSLDKIQTYKKNSQINEKDYALIERSYAIDNLKYWLLATKAKKECGGDYVVVLYFFSEKNCPNCPEQGVLLTYYKQKYDEKLLVFPINLDLEQSETALGILKGVYNITVLPSITIEDKKYEGVVLKEHLGRIICSNFENKSVCTY
jgi:thiol-disulfide isomerase/thioredoxin